PQGRGPRPWLRPSKKRGRKMPRRTLEFGRRPKRRLSVLTAYLPRRSPFGRPKLPEPGRLQKGKLPKSSPSRSKRSRRSWSSSTRSLIGTCTSPRPKLTPS
ncbi:unnamed protein product, partial [Arabidopsis halleri]